MRYPSLQDVVVAPTTPPAVANDADCSECSWSVLVVSPPLAGSEAAPRFPALGLSHLSSRGRTPLGSTETF
jgi:hypothetical protein